LLTNIFQKGVN